VRHVSLFVGLLRDPLVFSTGGLELDGGAKAVLGHPFRRPGQAYPGLARQVQGNRRNQGCRQRAAQRDGRGTRYHATSSSTGRFPVALWSRLAVSRFASFPTRSSCHRPGRGALRALNRVPDHFGASFHPGHPPRQSCPLRPNPRRAHTNPARSAGKRAIGRMTHALGGAGLPCAAGAIADRTCQKFDRPPESHRRRSG